MTKSLIRLDSIVRASLNDDCMTNSHDERQWDDNDDRTDDNTGITKGYNGGTRDYDSITRSYRREKEGERGRKREKEGIGTIGLDWLGRGWRVVSLVLKGIPASLVPSAWPSPHLSPHSPLPQSHPIPPSTSI